MNGTEMLSSRDLADFVARERTELLEELRDLVAQDVAFIARSKNEGFSVRESVRLALTPELTADGRPTLAVEGSTEGLPDRIFPKLAKGYTVNYQAAVRSPELAVEGETPPALPEPPVASETSAGGG